MTAKRRQIRPDTARTLIARAERQTGLDDWGDAGFREGLQVLIESLERDVEPHDNGRLFLLNLLYHALVNRLLLNRELARAEDALRQPVRNPLVIAAPPRSGSTLLHRLLARHPDALFLPSWALLEPMPPPPSLRRPDPGRRERAQATLNMQAELSPTLGVRHAIDADVPEDDEFLQLSSFRSMVYWAFGPVHGYVEWLAGQPRARRYRSLARQLQILQRDRRGSHWVLKSPVHFYELGTLLDELPDADVIVIHRDPLEVLPSLHSTFVALHATVTDRPKRARAIATNTDALTSAAARLVELADGPHAERIHHLAYRELAADPIAAAKYIHERFGLTWNEAVASEMKAWLAAHPRHERGEHRYDLESYGQNPDEIRARFGRYLGRFGSII